MILPYCEAFAEYFATVAEHNIRMVYGDLGYSTNGCGLFHKTFFFRPVCFSDVAAHISKLKNTMSSGRDGISDYIFKCVGGEVVDVLSYMINLSFENGRFPSVLKTAAVTPIYKKNDPKNIINYRPVALLGVVSKLLERVAYEQMMDFLTVHDLLNSSQHGYRKFKSTESALFDSMQYVYDSLDKGCHVAGIYFDLTRAFDCIGHSIIAKKLYSLGFRGKPLDWIMSYLVERKLVVRLAGSESMEKKINLGVPQGSILGPLMFLIAINDLPNSISCGFPILYADDTSVMVSAASSAELERRVHTVIDDMNSWCMMNRLVINHEKTQIVYYHKNRQHNTDIVFQPSATALGVKLDEKLTWDCQIDAVCNKLNSVYYLMLQLKTSMSTNHLIDIYYALAYSVMSYNTVLWGKGVAWNRVFVIQKRIIRLMFGLQFRASCRGVFRERQLLTFPCILIYKAVVYVKQNIEKFIKGGHEYGTRQAGLLVVPQHHMTLYKKSPLYICTVLYNGLPRSCKLINNVNGFKNSTKMFLKSKSFYSIDEYLNDLYV